MLLRLINSWLEESGQWFENIDRIRLVLASGMPVVRKSDGHAAVPAEPFDETCWHFIGKSRYFLESNYYLLKNPGQIKNLLSL